MNIDGGGSNTILMAALTRSQVVGVNQKSGSSAAENASDALYAAEGENSAETYDFSDMTPKRLFEVMNNLIKQGKMSLDESSGLLALFPIPIEGEKIGDMAAYTQPMNCFDKLQKAIEYSEYSCNSSGVHYYSIARDALQRFQGAKAGVDILA